MSRFSLPVMKHAGTLSPADLLRRSLHLEELYEGQLGDRASLPFGLAIMNADLPGLNMANQMREVGPAEGMTPAEMVQAVNAAFAERGVACRRWVFQGGRGDPQLLNLLQTRGFARRESDVWALAQPNAAGARHDLMVIPGRASVGKVAEVMAAVSAEKYGPETADLFARATDRLLDEPAVDCLLALEDTQAAGVATVVIEGETAFLAELMVHPNFRRRKVGLTLLERVIELAGRSRARSLTLFCSPENEPARRLYERTGFAAVGKAEAMELVGAEKRQ